MESTVRSLRKEVLGKTFVGGWQESGKDWVERAKGKKVVNIERVGKNILLLLDDGYTMLVHLRMTGYLLLGNWKYKDNEWIAEEKDLEERSNRFLRFILFLDDGRSLALSDARKFAKVSFISRKEERDLRRNLGPDPFSLSKKDFLSLLKGKKREIKPLLMDQSFLAGIGNIYASEILFKAKINPKKKSYLLNEEEIESIYCHMKDILEKAIELKGDSTSDYRLTDGSKGGYQERHLVYKREGLPCFDCHSRIKRSTVGNRGTYFCPKCQKL